MEEEQGELEMEERVLISLIDFLSGRMPVSDNWWEENRESVIKETLERAEYIGVRLEPNRVGATRYCQKCFEFTEVWMSAETGSFLCVKCDNPHQEPKKKLNEEDLK